MKYRFIYILLMGSAVFLTNCKKGGSTEPAPNINSNEFALSSAAAAAPRTVVTIAGKYDPSGKHLVDGIGRNARFYLPQGIQLMSDGNLYVADALNNAIRKVSVSTGEVTTLNFPTASDDDKINGPQDVMISKNGNVNIIGSNYNSDFSQLWVFKSDKSLTGKITYYYAAFLAFAENPYDNSLLFSSDLSIAKLKITNGIVDFTETHIDSEILGDDHLRGETFGSIFVGYNKVIYFTKRGHIFKLTLGGVTQEIFKDLHFTNITSLIVNKDSRTIYVADDFSIKEISNGKLTTLVGPSSVFDSRDGVGRNADVHANRLAFGKTENIIYFSDTGGNAIRKLTLD